jgi:hypothetical protein
MNTSNSTHPEKNRFERRFPPFNRSLLTQHNSRTNGMILPKGLTLKTMKHAVATHNKRRLLVVASQDLLPLSLSSPNTPLPHIFPIKN